MSWRKFADHRGDGMATDRPLVGERTVFDDGHALRVADGQFRQGAGLEHLRHIHRPVRRRRALRLRGAADGDGEDERRSRGAARE